MLVAWKGREFTSPELSCPEGSLRLLESVPQRKETVTLVAQRKETVTLVAERKETVTLVAERKETVTLVAQPQGNGCVCRRKAKMAGANPFKSHIEPPNSYSRLL